MKRKASQAIGSDRPAKLSKESTAATVEKTLNKLEKKETVKLPAVEPLRFPSFRQRKAPAWLSSYVTDNTPKEPVVKQPSKPAIPRFPTLVPPSKRKVQPKKDTIVEEKEEEPPSLRKQSTLKLKDSPPHSTKTKSMQKSLNNSPSLSKKATEILSSSDIDSEDSLPESKPDLENMKKKSSVVKTFGKSPAQPFSKTSSSQKQSGSKPLCAKPSKRNFKSKSSIHVYGVDAPDSDVVEVCDTKKISQDVKPDIFSGVKMEGSAEGRMKPNMLEVVICVSTSGAMREYLSVLQEKTRDLVWSLQSLIPNLRIGVFAHTQGGIHDDKSRSSAIDHNYIRTGGHSGTKWLDLGATFSQICAFVDSLEPEATVYPDYVQDNLEMSLWKLQRCMSWSSCSYRTVVMVGRGRPNRTSFYLQKEHWRGWIRSALEINHKVEIPIIDWELEAKLLAQMGIHVFTIQAVSQKSTNEEEEDEGSVFFRRLAEITNGQHIRLTEPTYLIDIIVGVCCACHGPELLQDHRDTLRDANDGVLPPQLREIIVSLQLHSKRRSLMTIPSLVGDLSALRHQLAQAEVNGNISNSEEEWASSGDEEEQMAQDVTEDVKPTVNVKSEGKTSVNKSAGGTPKLKTSVGKKANSNPVKGGRVGKNKQAVAARKQKALKNAMKGIMNKKVENSKTPKSSTGTKPKTDKTPATSQPKISTQTKSQDSKKEKGMAIKGGRVAKAKTQQAKAKSNGVKAAAKLLSNVSNRGRGKVIPKPAVSSTKVGKIKVDSKAESNAKKDIPVETNTATKTDLSVATRTPAKTSTVESNSKTKGPNNRRNAQGSNPATNNKGSGQVNSAKKAKDNLKTNRKGVEKKAAIKNMKATALKTVTKPVGTKAVTRGTTRKGKK